MPKEDATVSETKTTTLLSELRGSNSGLARLINGQLAVQPDHEKFLTKSFNNRDRRLMETTDLVANMVCQIIDPDFEEHAASYKWFCGEVNEEVLNFFRTGKYRHTSFAEVASSVYHDPIYMKRYMQGLLLSQVFWQNHTQVMDYYINDFLAELPSGARFLEIGPGHGLLSALATQSPAIKLAEAWDISDASLLMTSNSLKKLAASDAVTMRKLDVTTLTETDAPRFDAIVLSEILEHLEDPRAVLQSVARCLAPGGRLFINVPVNSPAIDHIFLLESPEEARSLVEGAGFAVDRFKAFPASGYTEELARSRRLTLSCVMQASPPTQQAAPS